METIIKIYHDLFPLVELKDWFFAFMGIIMHLAIKLKNIPFKHFKWSLFFEEFLPVWYFSLATVFICMGILPREMVGFSAFDAALIGYSSSSIFKQLLKSRLSQLGVNKE
jgi:hypothetical protein